MAVFQSFLSLSRLRTYSLWSKYIIILLKTFPNDNKVMRDAGIYSKEQKVDCI